MIADAVVKYLDCSAVEKMEVAGPGFLNFYLKSDWLYEGLARILEKGESYGNLPKKAGEKIQIEFVSANPTGPLHVGHGRGAAVGSSLANLMLAAGYDVTREYLINDAGNQMHNLALSVNARYLELFGKEVSFPENGYHGEDIIVTARRIKEKYGDKFLHMEETERLSAFQTLAKDEKLAALREDLEAFNCKFDVWFSEQSLHDAGKIKEAVDTLQKAVPSGSVPLSSGMIRIVLSFVTTGCRPILPPILPIIKINFSGGLTVSSTYGEPIITAISPA